jgi:molybdopterin-guanine dinucleotide biosynthesis protein MobB
VAAFERVFGVAGWGGSGKTTLLERLIPALVADGLSVVVVKHDAHGLALDVEGKDSERLFRAGAEVVMDAPAERLIRERRSDDESFAAPLVALQRRCDVVLVEGYKSGPHPKVWLLKVGDSAAPAEVGEVLAVLPWDDERVAAVGEIVRRRLTQAWESAPRRAGILVGGASRRMGTPKQWLRLEGETLLSRVAGAIAGAGPLALLGNPSSSPAAKDGAPAVANPVAPASDRSGVSIPGWTPAQAVQLTDAPGVCGPLAGILAALRWDPVTWLVASCDLPRLRADAVEWLAAQRQPGRWAVMPRVDGVVQPLLAVYEPQALPLLEALAVEGAPSPSRLEGHPHVATPEPPPHLADCWRGVNTPEELAALS